MFSPEQGSIRSQIQKFAKELSLEGQVHKENMARLDKEAMRKYGIDEWDMCDSCTSSSLLRRALILDVIQNLLLTL
jgi:hypothetical protein